MTDTPTPSVTADQMIAAIDATLLHCGWQGCVVSEDFHHDHSAITSCGGMECVIGHPFGGWNQHERVALAAARDFIIARSAQDIAAAMGLTAPKEGL